MSEFLIRCVSGDGCLRLRDYSREDSDPYADAGFGAEVECGGLRAAAGIYDVACTAWAAYFQDLAENWRGWDGTKCERSVEGHLELEATADSTGHITLRVTLSNEPLYDVWRASCRLRLEAGQLEALAKRASRFFGS